MLRALDPQTTARHASAIMPLAEEIFPLVEGFYVDLHHNPELSEQEFRTARTVAEWLNRCGFEVTSGVGGTGVVGVLRNGDGPTVLLRGDMDALPVREQTELPYASTARATEADGTDVPVMHACGHDVHTACLVGAADLLSSARDNWRGTLVVVAQPAEELASGARAMVKDGLYSIAPRPDVVLAQHVGPHPAGMVIHREGTLFAAAGSYGVRVFGVGGHAARPFATVDPVLIAANIVTRLQGIVAREVDPTDTAVVTVGVLSAGTRGNIIPDQAYLEVDIRAFDQVVHARVESAVRRVIQAEAQAAGAPREPEVTLKARVAPTLNEPTNTEYVRAAHRAYFGEPHVLDLPDPRTGSEDFGEFASHDSGDPIPSVYWLIGGTPHDVWENAPGETPYEKLANVPENHSPFFAPDREPTLRAGMAAMTVAVLGYLGTEEIPEVPLAVPDSQGTAHAETAQGPAIDAPIPSDESAGAGGFTTQQADMSALLGSEVDSALPPPPPSGPAFAAPPPPPQGAPLTAPPPTDISSERQPAMVYDPSAAAQPSAQPAVSLVSDPSLDAPSSPPPPPPPPQGAPLTGPPPVSETPSAGLPAHDLAESPYGPPPEEK